MKRFIRGFFMIGFVLTGVGLLLYPTVANWINEANATGIQAAYDESIDSFSEEEIRRLREEAEAYNENLISDPDPFRLSDEDYERYFETLDVTGTGVMCSVDIPTLGVKLPVYHTADQTVLSAAVGHIEGSSLPVGGKGTHALLTAHRGLPSAKLFTSLDSMRVGDVFFVEVLGETLTYRVENIWTVLPDDFEHLYIDPEEDLVTLITCTPYTVNTHRLLVQGKRFDMTSNFISFDDNRMYRVHMVYVIEYVCLSLLGVLSVLMGILIYKRRT